MQHRRWKGGRKFALQRIEDMNKKDTHIARGIDQAVEKYLVAKVYKLCFCTQTRKKGVLILT